MALGNKALISEYSRELGCLYQDQGDYDTALKCYKNSLEIATMLGLKSEISKNLHHLGVLAYDQGDYHIALKHYEDSLEISNALSNNLLSQITFTS